MTGAKDLPSTVVGADGGLWISGWYSCEGNEWVPRGRHAAAYVGTKRHNVMTIRKRRAGKNTRTSESLVKELDVAGAAPRYNMR